MEHTDLCYAISVYCKEKNFDKTLNALNETTDQITNEKCNAPSVAAIFEKYFNKQHEGLSFAFNLPNRQTKLRKRLLDKQCDTQVTKKIKVVKARKNDIPDQFLTLLDELGLDKKNAKLLYENKEQWAYVKSDRLIYCAERGKFSAR